MIKPIQEAVWATKTVTKTDKEKGAYVPTREQQLVLKSAGLVPEQSSDKKYAEQRGKLANTDADIEFSYYAATRGDPARTPEPRLGKASLMDQIAVGDELTIAWDGQNIRFFANARPSVEEQGGAQSELRRVTSLQYQRDSRVVRQAKERANYECEMPGCSWKPFLGADGRPYVEVHHVQPLSENGKDDLRNCAALCPACHRKVHYSINAGEIRKALEMLRR